ALTEQVVQDVITSAFGSAGQRCSCLRVLYIQDDVADVTIKMLCGAMAELTIGDPTLLSTDIGPVIDQDAYAKLQAHKARLQHTAKLLYAVPINIDLQQQNYFPPCAFEINSITEIPEEIFGPVLHV